jgi:hypothetical protein
MPGYDDINEAPERLLIGNVLGLNDPVTLLVMTAALDELSTIVEFWKVNKLVFVTFCNGAVGTVKLDL